MPSIKHDHVGAILVGINSLSLAEGGEPVASTSASAGIAGVRSLPLDPESVKMSGCSGSLGEKPCRIPEDSKTVSDLTQVRLAILKNRQESAFQCVCILRDRHATIKKAMRQHNRLSRKRSAIYNQYSSGALRHSPDAEKHLRILHRGMVRSLSRARTLNALRSDLATRLKAAEDELDRCRRELRSALSVRG